MLKQKYYVYGDQNVQVPAHINFGKFMLERFLINLDKVALEEGDSDKCITYKELAQYAVNLAQGLIELGVKKGDVVAIASERNIYFIPIVFGIILTGATYTPYYVDGGRTILKHKLHISRPKYVISSKLFWDTHFEWLQAMECVEKIIPLKSDFKTPDGTVSAEELASKDVDILSFEPAIVKGQIDSAAIFYSSGTTGLPKGVQLAHLNCILNSYPTEYLNMDIKTAFIFGEWYHNYDSFMTFKMLAAGMRVVYVPFTEDSVRTLKCFEKCKVNIAFLTPTSVQFLAKAKDIQNYNLKELQFIYCRSSPLHVKTILEVKKLFPNVRNILQGYGMTEAGEPTSENWAFGNLKQGSIGKACPGITFKIVDVETQEILGPNKRGEICLRGPVLMKGYIGKDPSTYLEDDGFFKTGDLGYYDEDEYFYIIDRLKEIINCGGDKVAPLELETLLLLHPEVKEAGVVGKPDVEMVELPTAFVVRQPGSKVNEAELQKYVEKEVPEYMFLKGGIKFIEKVPRNPRGKLLRSELRKML